LFGGFAFLEPDGGFELGLAAARVAALGRGVSAVGQGSGGVEWTRFLSLFLAVLLQHCGLRRGRWLI